MRPAETRRSVLSGLFLVLDGPDGGGKTTQARCAVECLERRGYEVVHLREPGGTAIGEEIRRILLDPAHTTMRAETETLLYLAARMQLVREVIEPALERGAAVVCERFIYSTIAYQSAHGDVTGEQIRSIWSTIAPRVQPDRVLFLDVDPDVGLERLEGARDRMEALGAAFHRRVYENYRSMAAAWPDLIETIDASQPVERVSNAVRAAIDEVLSNREDEVVTNE